MLALGAVALAAVFIGRRANLVTESYGRYVGCGDCLEPSVWTNDGYLLAGLVALVALSRLVRSGVARGAMVVAALVFILFFTFDLFIFQLLTHRLLVEDLLRYGPEAGTLLSVGSQALGQRGGQDVVLGGVMLAGATALAIAAGPTSKASAAVWSGASGLLFATCLSGEEAHYLHQVAFKNVFQVNVVVDSSRPYGPGALHKARLESPAPTLCEAGYGRSSSVILLVVESLSPYHSKLFSGLRDLTPRLDDLARQGTYFTRFFANGYSTEGGLIALLTGHVPMPTAGQARTVMAFDEVDGRFHAWLDEQGYQTAFFTSGLLSYGSRGRWLRAIGIAHAEGGEHRFYEGMARGAFGAPSDRALFDRFLSWHAHERSADRFFATVLTVETHPPYPGGLDGSDEAARFARVDEEIERFVSELRARGFFGDGILVIVGDHRAMTPISRQEQRLFGPFAPMLVPAIVLGDAGLPRGEVGGNLQQVDFIPSVRRLIGDRDCRTQWQGAFLGGDIRHPQYILYADPMQRNELGVVDGNARYRVQLDGDDTRWLHPPPRDADRLLAYINRERIGRMAEFKRVAAAKAGAGAAR